MIAGTFYTYVHTRADDGRVFYVGKGRGSRAHSHKGRNQRWQRTEKKHGLKVEIAAHWPTESEAFEHERFLIACFRDTGHPLCNMTDGGEGASGVVPSEETREKLAAALRGRNRPAEVKEKISLANKGKKRTPEQNERNADAQRGKKISAEHIAAIVAANTGRVCSEETRSKIGAAHLGKTNSAEARAKISAANRGRVRSPEFCAMASQKLTGRLVSEATRQKMSLSYKGRTVPEEMRKRISQTLTGRKTPPETMEKLMRIALDPVRRANQSAKMKGRPWSAARRAAQNATGSI